MGRKEKEVRKAKFDERLGTCLGKNLPLALQRERRKRSQVR